MPGGCRLALLNLRANENKMKENKGRSTLISRPQVPRRQILGMIEVVGSPGQAAAGVKKRSGFFLQINFTMQSTLHERAKNKHKHKRKREKIKP